VENGYFEVVPKTGYIYTRDAFGDCQLHVEFAEPAPAKGESQDRGNSGRLSARPLRDSSSGLLPKQDLRGRPGSRDLWPIPSAGERFAPARPVADLRHRLSWTAFAKDGKLLRPARETVFHDGVLVQDNVELSGPTAHGKRPPYEPQPEKLPLALQDHNHPVRYRNIWIRD